MMINQTIKQSIDQSINPCLWVAITVTARLEKRERKKTDLDGRTSAIALRPLLESDVAAADHTILQGVPDHLGLVQMDRIRPGRERETKGRSTES